MGSWGPWLARWLGRWPWLVPQLLAILFMDRVNSSPLQFAAADFRTGWGTSPAVTSVSGIFFSVSNGDSTALCSLSFETNLRKIDYAEVSCDIKFTKSIRAAIFVFILCLLFFSFITFIFLILVVVLLLLVLLLFLLFLIFIFIVLVVLFIIFKKPQQIRPTSVLFWLEPKLESELRNAGVELATELSSLQYGMARYCFFHF